METIGALGKRLGVPRSTLLHYDRIGLLAASERSKSGYRLYTARDAKRLERITTLRRAGLGLADIAELLDSGSQGLGTALEARLGEIDRDVERLRGQQRFILGILKNPQSRARVGVMDKETWTGLLAASGFSEGDMLHWHAAFEQSAPDRHQAFLEFLCLPAAEVRAIRSRARARADGL
ncbi:MerR family transcriptional regulator [Desulfocurvus sp. DL9XJH121]